MGSWSGSARIIPIIPMYTGSLEALPEEFISFAREIYHSYGSLSKVLEYAYGFSVLHSKAEEEYLHYFTNNRQTKILIFERKELVIIYRANTENVI